MSSRLACPAISLMRRLRKGRSVSDTSARKTRGRRSSLGAILRVRALGKAARVSTVAVTMGFNAWVNRSGRMGSPNSSTLSASCSFIPAVPDSGVVQ